MFVFSNSSTSTYKYLGLKFTGQVCLNCIFEKLEKSKEGIVEICIVVWKIRCLDINVFFKVLDAQIVFVLLCGSEMWGWFDCSKV